MPTIIQQMMVAPGINASWSRNLTFAKFDTTLGTLTSITLALNVAIVGELDIFNFSGSAQTVTNGKISAPNKITGPDATNFTVTVLNSPLLSASIPAPTGVYPFPNQTGTNSGNTSIASGNYSFYQSSGGGSLTLTAQALNGTYSIGSIPNVVANGSYQAVHTVTLTYVYTGTGGNYVSFLNTETLSLTDVSAGKSTKANAETASFTDALVPRGTYTRTETFSLTDALLRAGKKGLTETCSFTDARAVLLSRSVQESLALSDAAGKKAIFALNQGITLSDAPAWIASPALGLSKHLPNAKADAYFVTGSVDMRATGYVDAYKVSGRLNRNG